MTLYRDILDPSRTVTVTNTDIARWSPLDWDQREIHVHGSEEREAENVAQSEKTGWGRKDLGLITSKEKPATTVDELVDIRNAHEQELTLRQDAGESKEDCREAVYALIRLNRAIYELEAEFGGNIYRDPDDNDSRLAEGIDPEDCDGRDQLECQRRTYEEDEGTHQLEISGVRTVAPSNARVQKHHLARHKHDELRAFITLQLEALGQKQDDPKIRSWIRKHTPYQIIDALQRRIAETPTQDLKGKWWKVVPLTAIPE